MLRQVICACLRRCSLWVSGLQGDRQLLRRAGGQMSKSPFFLLRTMGGWSRLIIAASNALSSQWQLRGAERSGWQPVTHPHR